MKAVRKVSEGAGNMVYMDVPEPVLHPGHVKIKIEYCGICGSDIKFYDWTMRAGMGIPIPITFGHECSGVVTEIGEGVTKAKPGDRVAAHTSAYTCGKCDYCLSGHSSLCITRKTLGIHRDGGMAEYICVSEDAFFHVPDEVSMQEAAMTEPLCVAMHGVFAHSTVYPGDVCLVFGPGSIGLAAVQVLKSCGARVILAGLSSDEARLRVGLEMGAQAAVVVDREDVASRVLEITGGRGADSVYECSGSAAALDKAIACVKKCGTVVEIALFKVGALPIENLNKLVNNEITLRGSYSHTVFDWRRSLDMMAKGQINIKPLATHVYPLNEFEKGFDAARQFQGIKVLLKP